jgi:hypothetical protein
VQIRQKHHQAFRIVVGRSHFPPIQPHHIFNPQVNEIQGDIRFPVSDGFIVVFTPSGTVEFSSEIPIPLSFTAECTENAEALETPSVDWNTLKLCAVCDLRGDKSLGF